MPTHNHGVTTAAGGHSHNRGAMNIWGSINLAPGTMVRADAGASGCFIFETAISSYSPSFIMESGYPAAYFDAQRNWNGITSTVDNHQHTTQDAGSGESHNNMQPYLAVAIWKRTA